MAANRASLALFASMRIEIEVTPAMRDSLYLHVIDTAQRLHDEIVERMPESDVVHAFLIFDARDLPVPLPAGYGEDAIEIFIRHYAPASMDPTLWLVNPTQLRDQWILFPRIFLSPRNGQSYREIAVILTSLPEEASRFSQILILLNIALLLPLANAVSEFGFSLQNNIKTTLRNKMEVDTTLDAHMRVVSLGPTDSEAISRLVDRAVPIVFANAMPSKRAGAEAANEIRRIKKRKKAAGAPSASSIIAGSQNNMLEGDGSADFSTAAFAPFPTDKFKSPLEIPVRDDTLIGKQILYVTDHADDEGLKFVQYKVMSGKQKKHNTAIGVPRLGGWRYNLKNARSEILNVQLRHSDYSPTGRWYLAKKK